MTAELDLLVRAATAAHSRQAIGYPDLIACLQAAERLAKRLEELEELEEEVKRLTEPKPTGDCFNGWHQAGSGQMVGKSADGFNSHTDG